MPSPLCLAGEITEHVKAQNQTAVAIDVVIVVVGVFIGIQVSNWNDARLGARRAGRAVAGAMSRLFSVHPDYFDPGASHVRPGSVWPPHASGPD